MRGSRAQGDADRAPLESGAHTATACLGKHLSRHFLKKELPVIFARAVFGAIASITVERTCGGLGSLMTRADG